MAALSRIHYERAAPYNCEGFGASMLGQPFAKWFLDADEVGNPIFEHMMST
jgi:hypothetical protein